MCLDLKDGDASEGGQLQQWECFKGSSRGTQG